MNLLKQIGTWIIGILLLILTLGMVKPGDKKWQEKAVDNEEKNVKKSLDKAKAANKQAKVHDDEANKIKSAAEKDVKSNQPTRSILDKWRGS